MALLTPVAGPTPTISRTNPPAADTVGTVVEIAGMRCEERGGAGPVHQTLFIFEDCELTIPDSVAYLGTKIYDFPQGYINVLAACFVGTLTTTSEISSTLNSGVAVNLGVGTATASNVTLAGTMMDIIPGSGETPAGFTSSTVIDVASAEITMVLAATVSAAHLAANLAGQATAKDLYFNLAVATATDIDANATVEVNGHLLVTWINTFVNP